MSLRSRLISLVFFSKSAATHFLAGNLAVAEVTTLNNEANLINLAVFLPQMNDSIVKKERATDLALRSVSSLDVANNHKSITNIAFAWIGTMVDMLDFSSFYINCNTVISTIVDSDSHQPLYHQILLKFLTLLNNPDFNNLYAANKGAMPHLHWHFYLNLKQISNLFVQFAMDFNNVNVMSESCPLSKLKTKPLCQALVTMKAFGDHLTLAQSMNSPIQILMASVSRYSISLNNTIVCAPWTNHNSTSPFHEIVQNDCCNLKRDPATPDNRMTLAADHR
jgi:hypothetical protein